MTLAPQMARYGLAEPCPSLDAGCEGRLREKGHFQGPIQGQGCQGHADGRGGHENSELRSQEWFFDDTREWKIKLGKNGTVQIYFLDVLMKTLYFSVPFEIGPGPVLVNLRPDL